MFTSQWLCPWHGWVNILKAAEFWITLASRLEKQILAYKRSQTKMSRMSQAKKKKKVTVTQIYHSLQPWWGEKHLRKHNITLKQMCYRRFFSSFFCVYSRVSCYTFCLNSAPAVTVKHSKETLTCFFLKGSVILCLIPSLLSLLQLCRVRRQIMTSQQNLYACKSMSLMHQSQTIWLLTIVCLFSLAEYNGLPFCPKMQKVQ